MLAARIRPGAPELEHVRERRVAGEPVAIAAPSVLELTYGLRKAALAGNARLAGHLRWLRGLLELGAVRVLPLDSRAAQLAGEARALRPAPPEPKRGERRSKAERRVAWLLDLQIAAAAYVHGHDVATGNARDFEAIASAFAELAPGAPPLEVVEPPPL
jgi:predicted nucleic acid-binding protein